MIEFPQIPGVEIEAELGRGAHSIVYRGTQRGVPCAIKLPRAKARWTRWIYREAVSLARVKHPLLPAVLEVGEIDGLPYLAMELVEGVTLADKLARGAVDEEAAIGLARQLASVLGAVHEAGLVHRDVKPRNIVVRSTGALKLVDFGFATPMERVGSGDTSGTAAYSAPEQLSPPGRVDGRADLYAVGRVLFECLSGASLSGRGDGPWGPEAREELVGAGVSSDLAEIVSGLLRETPEERYSSSGALLSDLDRLAAGQPVLGPRAYDHRRTPVNLVARRLELERVLGPIREHHASGSLTLIQGPRGSGKSRLLEALEFEGEGLGLSVFIQCSQHDPPHSALRRVLDAYWRQEEERSPETAVTDLRAAIGNLAPVVQLIAPVQMNARLALPSLTAPTSSGPGVAADSLAEGAAALLLRLAARARPLIIAIDDAQWLDSASTDALVRLAHRTAEAPVALVLAMRSEGSSDALEAFSAVRPGRSNVVALPKLTDHQVGELVAAHLGESVSDAALVARIGAMADGTPLGVLEVLGAFLDAGAVRPHARSWVFDSVRTDDVVLPRGALVLLGRRIAELPAATRRVLEIAALIGRSCDDQHLARVVDIALEDLGFALAGARRAGILEPEKSGRHRFVHDSLRESLVDEIPFAERRRIHQRIAEALDEQSGTTFEQLYAAARHFSAGEPEKNPERVYRVARAAGEAALARFDNETALRFFTQAREAAERARISLDMRFFGDQGEAHLRLGALDASLAAFEDALRRAADGKERAFVLGRLAWVYQTRAEPDQAWSTLNRAFQSMDARMPVENVASAATTSAHVARSRIGRLFDRRTIAAPPQTDLLCALHYQNARLGLEYGKFARLLQSGLECVELSEHGGSDPVRARAHAFYALALTALGRRDAATRELTRAKSIASRNADPATNAFCIQLDFVVRTWAGDFDGALSLVRECVDVHGTWLERNEYLQDVSTGDLIESSRGRADEAWAWMERGVERLRRARTRPSDGEFIIHRARAALAAIGRRVENDPWLASQFAAISPSDGGRGFHRLMSLAPRARYFLEVEELGADFEELVRSVQAEGHNPRSAHIGVVEYYVPVAHARIHQWLRAKPRERATWLSLLRAAVADLRAASKTPLFKAHSLFAEGCLAWFEGHERRAKKLLADGEMLANQHCCPWVLYGIARTRAHMLRAAGKEAAARDQARVAEVFAREHGAVNRARWVCEEFGLVASVAESMAQSRRSSRSSSRTHRQLTALLQVARAPRRDLRTEQQAGAILDELMSSLRAERGSIWFQPETGAPGTAVTRHRGSDISVSLGADSPRGALLRDVHRSGMPWPSAVGVEDSGTSSVDSGTFDPRRLLAVPLFLYEKPVGALCVERRDEDSPFGPDDRSLLVLLSHQVPVALEIARLLFEREQLQTSLQQAKKMEAMGQLAGGLAHDFNNMLSAMKNSLSVARERASTDTELTSELDVISQATTRASQLTSQLLSFSRHKPVPVAVHEVNQLIATVEPMLRRVVGSHVSVVTKLSPAVDAVEVDDGSFDQALVNLAINARDAMPKGGTLSISTRNVTFDEVRAQQLNAAPGDYVELEVADTGEGMLPETLARVFEPFFTTKPVGTGTGLGLAMVYAFARNCGGAIDVASEPGQGTQFRIYLKRAERLRASRPVRASASSGSLPAAPPPMANAPQRIGPRQGPHGMASTPGPDTILLVDDDDLVRSSTARMLERHGYRVLAASGSVEALDAARKHGDRIGLVILDMLMPGVTGPELGKRLKDVNLSAKLLFVSGFTPESIPLDHSQFASDMLLTKPFSQTTLLERVRQLMHS